MPRIAPVLLAVLLAAAPSAAAVVELGQAPCPDSPERCVDIEVTCDAHPAVAPAVAEVRVLSAADAAGAVAFFSGGQGVTPWVVGEPSQDVLTTLNRGRYVTAQVIWEDGWARGEGEGTDILACRTDAVLRWARQRWPAGPLCAVGNSGGSAQIAYSLARFGGADVVDLALLGSGPPIGRVDLGCDEDTKYWFGEETAIIDGSLGCAQALEDCPCETNDPEYRQRFFEMGVISPRSGYRYPGVEVAMLTGHGDDGSSVPQADLFEGELRAAQQDLARRYIPAAQHLIQASDEGAREVLTTLWTRCR